MQQLKSYIQKCLQIRKELTDKEKMWNEIYNEPIKAYPIFPSFSLCYEALMSSYPASNFIKKIKDKLPNFNNIKIKELPSGICDQLNSKENKYVIITSDEKYYEENLEKLYEICEFFGYDINHIQQNVDSLSLYDIYIYPKFQAEFLLSDEKYLIHFAPKSLLNKIKKQGLKPYSKTSKLDNIEKFNSHDDFGKIRYEKLLNSFLGFNHSDKIHFICGSQISKIKETFIKYLIDENYDNIVCLIIDVSKIRKDIPFCLDMNSTTSNKRITITTSENISPKSIVKEFDISADNIEISLSQIENFIENKLN